MPILKLTAPVAQTEFHSLLESETFAEFKPEFLDHHIATITIKRGQRNHIKSLLEKKSELLKTVIIEKVGDAENEEPAKPAKKSPSFPDSLVEFTLGMKQKKKPSELYKISNSKDCADVCRLAFNADAIDWIESFVVIALNRSNGVMGFYKISQGGISGTVADPRVIMQFALLCNASSLIIAHNHPSGSLRPSKQDEELTQRIKQAGMLLEIRVLDHIIVTSESYFSFADNGTL